MSGSVGVMEEEEGECGGVVGGSEELMITSLDPLSDDLKPSTPSTDNVSVVAASFSSPPPPPPPPFSPPPPPLPTPPPPPLPPPPPPLLPPPPPPSPFSPPLTLTPSSSLFVLLEGFVGWECFGLSSVEWTGDQDVDWTGDWDWTGDCDVRYDGVVSAGMREVVVRLA